MLVSIFEIDHISRNRFQNSLQLSENILKIQYYDELLTMSARMASASGDLRYKERYNESVEPLDLIIKSTHQLISEHGFQSYIKETDEANAKLVAMETNAFELIDQNKKKEAYQLLHSIEYLTQKAIYWDALNQASREVQAKNKARDRDIGNLTLLLKLLSASLILGSFGIVHRIYKSQQEIQKSKDQSEALHVVITTVSDLVGNAFNHLLLLKMRIDESSEFTEEERKIFDDAVYGTSQKLKSMREMKDFRTKETASGKLLDPD
jgi:hypothetical protein